MAGDVDTCPTSLGRETTPSLFSYFLSKLSEEHNREVSELCTRNSELSLLLTDPSNDAVLTQPPRPPLPPSRIDDCGAPMREGECASDENINWREDWALASIPLASFDLPVESSKDHPFANSTSTESLSSQKESMIAPTPRHSCLKTANSARSSVVGHAIINLPSTESGSSGLWISEQEEDEERSQGSDNSRSSSCLKGGRPSELKKQESRVSFHGNVEDDEEGGKDTRGKFKQFHINEFVEMQAMKRMTRMCADMHLTGATDEVVMEAYFQAWKNFATEMRTSISFSLHPSWLSLSSSLDANVAGQMTTAAKFQSHKQDTRLSTASGSFAISSSSEEVYQERRIIGFIVSPNSSLRILWDVIGAFLLLYDVCVIPMMVFDPPKTDFTITMGSVTLIFWTFDMLASLMTGYFEKGCVVMVPRRILRNYLRGWFCLDVVVVVPDWIFTVMERVAEGNESSRAADSGDVGKMLRALRILRIARLLRLAKLKRMIAIIKDQIQSERSYVWLDISKLILVMLMVNHHLACMWYAIGDAQGESASWINHGGYGDTSLAFRYTTSLHWSLTQFTPASMEVQPKSVAERIYSIVVLVFGLVLFSSVVGSITSSMTQLRGMSEENDKQFWLLRKYLRQRGIQPALSFRVLRFSEYVMYEQKDLVSDQRIWLLSHLSDQLRDELSYEVSFSCMNDHPLFFRMAFISDDMMQRLSRTALSQQHLAPGDLLFNAGSQATHMHMVVTGDFQYVKAEDLRLEDPLRTQYTGGDWACEAALWLSWTCVGSSRTGTESTLVQIEAEAYSKALSKDAASWSLASHYAANYAIWMNNTHMGRLSDFVRNVDLMAAIFQGFVDDFGADLEPQTPVKAVASTLIDSFSFNPGLALRRRASRVSISRSNRNSVRNSVLGSAGQLNITPGRPSVPDSGYQRFNSYNSNDSRSSANSRTVLPLDHPSSSPAKNRLSGMSNRSQDMSSQGSMSSGIVPNDS